MGPWIGTTDRDRHLHHHNLLLGFLELVRLDAGADEQDEMDGEKDAVEDKEDSLVDKVLP
jgi:hypothetical protein